MAKQPTPTTNKEAPPVSDLEALAVRLDAMSGEATEMGEDRLAKTIANAAKSARHYDKQNGARRQKVGKLVMALQAKGLSAEEIVAALTK
jgi:hypothetical protein